MQERSVLIIIRFRFALWGLRSGVAFARTDAGWRESEGWERKGSPTVYDGDRVPWWISAINGDVFKTEGLSRTHRRSRNGTNTANRTFVFLMFRYSRSKNGWKGKLVADCADGTVEQNETGSPYISPVINLELKKHTWGMVCCSLLYANRRWTLRPRPPRRWYMGQRVSSEWCIRNNGTSGGE